MGEKILAKGTIPFQAEGRLLQELGERLVASPEVALVELIKNAYDADSPSCEVRLADSGKTLVVSDKGHGMTLDEFSEKWMRIATSSKVEERVSRTYSRRLTGAKGIGRFAVRSLGDYLTLTSIALDPKRKTKTQLTARFDWPKIDRLSDIRNAEIDYTLEEMPPDTATGTTLEVRKLKTSTEFTGEKSLRSSVVRIVTPLRGLHAGRFKASHEASKTEPGFQVLLPGDRDSGRAEIDIAGLVLKNHWARLQIELEGNHLTFKVWFSSTEAAKTLRVKVSTAISAGFVADIRFFPRRKGVFRGKEINGQVAWDWVRRNHGVAVVDHGFRIVPYGDENDDWLHLDVDKAHSERDWRSKIAQKDFAISPAVRSRPALNPALNLPYNFQLVGAVFVESKPPSLKRSAIDLIPSMDREGFLKNRAFDELVDFVRAGIEFLAWQDKLELDRVAAKEARKASRSLREDFRRAIDHIKRSPTLSAPDKARITKAYSQLAERIEEVEDYNEKARQSLMTMSLLGVVAGFMTHETKSIVFEMEKAARIITSLAKKHPDLGSVANEIDRRLAAFKGQLEYSQMFLNGVRGNKSVSMSASGQIRYVLKRFEGFATDHGITVTWDADSKVETPRLPPAVYSGVLLNLYTNALKAVLAGTSSIRDPKIALRAWNERKVHYIEVSDNGVGIPTELRKRIWDPLYTTTSDTGNPLGSGMGLGLTLVKQVVEDSGGKVALTEDPPPGFSTCFRVTFPRSKMPIEIKVILFEDAQQTQSQILAALRNNLKSDGTVLPFDGTLFKESDEDQKRMFEDRLVSILRKAPYDGITLVVADRDLSMSPSFRGMSVSAVIGAAKTLAIPICSYARQPAPEDYKWRSRWEEGHIVIASGDDDELSRQAILAARGFAEIASKLPAILKAGVGKSPAKILAALLEKRNTRTKLHFMASETRTDYRKFLKTQKMKQIGRGELAVFCGYWLWDSLLRYPGLLVNEVAAGSHLNIQADDFRKAEIRRLFADALYAGPFTDEKKPQWWRGMLDDMVSRAGCDDGLQFAQKNSGGTVHASQCWVDSSKSAGYYCIISEKPVSLENSRGGLSWFPRGADLTRITTRLFEEYGPWIGA